MCGVQRGLRIESEAFARARAQEKRVCNEQHLHTLSTRHWPIEQIALEIAREFMAKCLKARVLGGIVSSSSTFFFFNFRPHDFNFYC